MPLHNTSVIGVGCNKAKAEGKGTIELISWYNNQEYILRLQNVLYIPTNRNNLLSLGKWDAAGGQYIGGGGKITLKNKNGDIVAAGTKILNNLYKMKLQTWIPCETHIINSTKNLQTFTITEPVPNLETWHRWFGHVSYTGLQRLFDRKMVDGFTVDINTPKPDCEACIQAKHTIAPFNGKSNCIPNLEILRI